MHSNKGLWIGNQRCLKMFELLHYNDVACRGRHFDREWVCRRLHERWGICQGEQTHSWKSCQRSPTSKNLDNLPKSLKTNLQSDILQVLSDFSGDFIWGYVPIWNIDSWKFLSFILIHTHRLSWYGGIWCPDWSILHTKRVTVAAKDIWCLQELGVIVGC